MSNNPRYLPPLPRPRRKKKKYKEAWTIFGPVKIYPPTVLCPGIVREGNRAIPVQRIYENVKSEESETGK